MREVAGGRKGQQDESRGVSLERLMDDFRYWFFFLRPRKSDVVAVAGHVREFLRYRKEKRDSKMTLAEHVQATLTKELEDIEKYI